MRKFGILAGLLVLLLAAAPAFAGPITIKFSHVVAVDTPKGQAAEYFKKLVEERSNGEIKVEVYPNSSLFDDKDIMTPLMTNAVQMAAPSFSKFTSFAPNLQLVDLPFLFNDADHLHKVLAGEVGQKILDTVGKKGLVGLSFWDSGFKQLSANKPLLMPADAAGLKFRIMSSKVLEAQFKAVNANPQVLPFSEVYSALQQGVVDACENPLSNFYTKKFYEVQSDLTMSNHGYLGYLVVTNKIFWSKLNDQQKTLITQAMKEATQYGNDLALKMDLDYLAKVKESGKTTVHELTPAQRKAWQEAMMAIYPEFYDVIGKDLIDAALAAGK
ncbi:TRAP transporter substrate-binding protein [Desulfuromonas carbonis]|uniref:TRAP transporter substrate-binding protein n=1 Tax=Desulfuromonas sp. DDH964 TaxID=1823759 RepID=UPI00078CD880|nr:TRAP transporter substrate-binding protein [Desulfuromonas sp. DDH964]AMV71647.1 TRAP proton/solute symporter, periplasmic substrate-binding protein [Desulfuromonas sp. DDH964]